MSNIQVKQLNTTKGINCAEQQQIYGGFTAKAWDDYAAGLNNITNSTGSVVTFSYDNPDGDKTVVMINTERKANNIVYAGIQQ